MAVIKVPRMAHGKRNDKSLLPHGESVPPLVKPGGPEINRAKALPSRRKVGTMDHYVVLGRWTEQGARTVKETTKRADAVKAVAQKHGGKFELWWTMGEYDFVGVLDAPNDEIANQIILTAGIQGNVRTRTMKAWTAPEMEKLISKISP
jgi:uncharacterized protein with GYD domain